VGVLPPPFGSIPAALPALTGLRVGSSTDVDVSRFTGLRGLVVLAKGRRAGESRAEGHPGVKGLSGLTTLEEQGDTSSAWTGPWRSPRTWRR
jgi:hypothetical protein